MTSQTGGGVVLGSQHPRVCLVPEYVSSAGDEAVELAALAGLVLDPWEAFVLKESLGERKDGKWAAFEVGLVVPRQNGKGSILEARELAGLFLLGERLLVHSAHQFDTSLEHFRRLLSLVEETPEFSRRVRRVSRSHGEEGIELFGGQRIRFRTRTKGGGRGFTGDFLALDEAMILSEMSHGALLPTLSARPNPQVWYCGSAVDQQVHDDGWVLSRVRDRGLAGDAGLAYFEWSVGADSPDVLEAAEARSDGAWGTANPGLGIRISREHIDLEQRSMDPRTFAVERLGVGDWPVAGVSGAVISLDAWRQLADDGSVIVGDVCVAFDVTPERSSSAICAAGLRADGLWHVEVIDRRRGTFWVVDRLVEVIERHQPSRVLCDGMSPAGSLIHELEQRDVEVTAVTAKEHGYACGMLYDAVAAGQVRHLPQPELDAAIQVATKRPLGDAWAWSRKNSSGDISPLVGCTLAFWAASTLVAAAEPWLVVT